MRAFAVNHGKPSTRRFQDEFLVAYNFFEKSGRITTHFKWSMPPEKKLQLHTAGPRTLQQTQRQYEQYRSLHKSILCLLRCDATNRNLHYPLASRLTAKADTKPYAAFLSRPTVISLAALSYRSHARTQP